MLGIYPEDKPSDVGQNGEETR